MTIDRYADAQIIVAEGTLACAQALIQQALDRSTLTRKEIYALLQVDAKWMREILAGDRVLTIGLLAEILYACGFEVRLNLVRAGGYE